MKTKDIADRYDLDNAAFDAWLKKSDFAHKVGIMGGVVVADGQDIDQIVKSYKDHQARSHERAKRERAALERRQEAMSKMLITSGFSFDGYTITKYSGYISGDAAEQVPRLVSVTTKVLGMESSFQKVADVGEAFMAAMVKIRRKALVGLKEAALDLGCNAVIGVDFDYLTLAPETGDAAGQTIYLPYVFGVTANGNAVTIEKNGPAGSP